MVTPSPPRQVDERRLLVVQTRVEGPLVDLWLSPLDQPMEAPAAMPEVTEDGVAQAQVTLAPVQQQPLDIAVVVSPDADAPADWFVRTLQTILRPLPEGTGISLSVCGASQPELVSTTRDRNLVLNSFIQAQSNGRVPFGRPCDLHATIDYAMVASSPPRDPQSFSRRMLVVLGTIPTKHPPTSSLTWAVVPPEGRVARRDDVRVLVLRGDDADAGAVESLVTAVRAQSQILHVQYRSTALPGSRRVQVRYPAYSAVETDVMIPVIPPEVTLRPPDTTQFEATGAIMLGVDVRVQQSPLKQVRYFVDDQLVGTAHTAPFDLRWQADSMPGNRILRAEVTDQYDATATTPPANVSIVVDVRPSDYRLPLLAAGVGGLLLLLLLLYLARRTKPQRLARLETIPLFKGPIPELRIRVTYYGGATSVHTYRRTSVTIGSDPALALLSLKPVGVEPLHVTLRQRARGVMVEPHARTVLSGRVLDRPALIPIGAELQLGSAVLRLEPAVGSTAKIDHLAAPQTAGGQQDYATRPVETWDR